MNQSYGFLVLRVFSTTVQQSYGFNPTVQQSYGAAVLRVLVIRFVYIRMLWRTGSQTVAQITKSLKFDTKSCRIKISITIKTIVKFCKAVENQNYIGVGLYAYLHTDRLPK